MKKTIFILICLICASYTTRANAAAAMCVKQNTTMVVLDATATPESNSYNETQKSWSKTFSWGVVRGIAFCSNTRTGVDYSTTDDATVAAMSDGTNYCYCKMTFPVVSSRWVITSGGAQISTKKNCKTTCASYCATKNQIYNALISSMEV